ncbi:hypothetical protein Hs30E_18870 [Lactococcus hodotermopsidis]|uniref:Uncharacterized protein n=1 Tax=Pseudolactococcus hodotermopsidis TaxID=2709157 RepID=A0A6A0BEY1_9LACT|nr:hypothetical protein [Lactococcus hodotermopsidis]GFH43336.1 hypothetical protein Hs30E_18870 [Lactococcus hodotermopsidis]
MIIIYKGKGRWVVVAFVISFFTVLLNQNNLPTGNQYFAPVILFSAALLNLIFTHLFVKNEVELTDDEFQTILMQQKERFPKRKYGKLTLKFIRISLSNYSSLFFVRNKNWTSIFLILAIILFVLFSIFPS